MRYWKVKAKCGHVRRSRYLVKSLYVKASTKKEAAAIARNIPRVKHNHPDAIRDVEEISPEQYALGRKEQSEDPYFSAKSKQDQNRFCTGLEEETLPEESPLPFGKITHKRRHLVEARYSDEWGKERSQGLYDQ